MRSQVKHLTVVVEGLGDVVQKYYAPALKVQKDLYGKNLTVIFVDESKYWRVENNGAQIERNENFKNKMLTGWAKYIDKSDKQGEHGEKEYLTLKADVVFIATPDFTHIKLASFWLSEEDRCKSIFVEKPIDSDLRRARVLQYYSLNDPKVHALDHYLARFASLTDPLTMKGLFSMLGGDITEVSFYLLEDRSSKFQGPIEAELRTSALQKGLVLDLFPHILALLHHLGRVETIVINDLRVGKYSYDLDENGNIGTPDTKETFAHLTFSFISHADNDFKNNSGNDNLVLVNAYVGKGIGGSEANRALNLNPRGEVKFLEIVGKNGRKCYIDLRNTNAGGTGKVEVKGEHGEPITKDGLLDLSKTKLFAEPYAFLIGQIIQDHFHILQEKMSFLLTPQDAKDSLTIMDEIISLIELFERTNTEIPLYHIKTKKSGEDHVSLAPMLEELIDIGSIRQIIGMKQVAEHYKGLDLAEHAEKQTGS